MKRLIMIDVAGSKRPVRKVRIGPRTKVRAVLARLKLDERYVLSPASSLNTHFDNDEVLYGRVTNEEQLIAHVSTAEADASMERIAFGEGEI